MQGPTLERKNVYDPLLRLIHATLALSVLGLAATGWGSGLVEDNRALETQVWEVHFLMGKVLAVTVAVRVVWGLVGPLHARWKDLWHPQAWLGVLRGRWPTARRFGHDVMASATYLALYGLLGMMVATGLGLQSVEHGTGPLGTWLLDRVTLGGWMEEPHEVGAAAAMGFFALHLLGMGWHVVRERRPVFRAMATGQQFQPRAEV